MRIYFRRCFLLTGRILLLLLITLVLIYTEALFSGKFIVRRDIHILSSFSGFTNHSQKKISKIIHEVNTEEKIRNVNRYGALKENTIIIVVNVEKNSNTFNIFLSSLSEIIGIEEALVIFSHSLYDDKLNDIIKSIDFCRVLQIFYPYSLQTHSQKFPGTHINDCPFYMDFKTAKKINCTNALFPDINGHYRNAVMSERKHHWWWTANQVFERLQCTRKHTGLVIFLEDDLLFKKDFIYMANYMKNVAGSFPKCEFVSLGTHFAPDTKYKINDICSAIITTWDPKIHWSVLAFNIVTWNVIAAQYESFCDVDDASWSRSLGYMSANSSQRKFKVISSKIPRAFKIDTCNDQFNCYRTQIPNVTEQALFPPYMDVYVEIWRDFTPDLTDEDPGGGWADPRDIALCHKMTANKMKKIIREIEMY